MEYTINSAPASWRPCTHSGRSALLLLCPGSANNTDAGHDASSFPGNKAIVSMFVTVFVSPTAALIGAVADTHWCSAARLHDIVTNLTGYLPTVFIDWLHSSSVPSIPDTVPGFSYPSCSTQTADDDFCSWASLEMFTDGLNHLSDFFDTGQVSVRALPSKPFR